MIWGRDPQAHAQQLADVHGLLGEVAMESDDFGTALAELEASLGYLAQCVEVRRGAAAAYWGMLRGRMCVEAG